ncbi:hypothetical protein GLOTRDRAFT_114971 [Gloeophyllum trabeum ATCC 11539]|uniref:Sterol regulatory element-binding protein cleavage-activating protein n=1 Tax=Gloeophyllum trabeum (strain ATCC 11539 / FP-39264 / Madison 617) TaxID=670483 RepID=S7RV29_GLOTA|nr:uncharacterized protein GLOTRDRAFT_114971 [Gloeophyllum trabeum ATCC 11539]EPQ58620.1 hypothetical protein GLOTRDRAFT_114971 [Gloeophyllum trabeum ATCC 11539]
MFSIGPTALYWARQVGHRYFHQFGIHCATHQIRVILISCVVITSLFYPALAIYSSSQPQFIAHISSRILDSFRSVEGSGYHTYGDIRNLWTGLESLRIIEDPVARARCGNERTLRVERVLVHSPDEAGALDVQVLLSTLALEKRIHALLPAHGLSCLKTPDGSCLTISPSAFWNHDEDRIRADPDVRETLSLTKNTSVAGIPVLPLMVLAGRELDAHTATKVEYAAALVLTYFFPETDCTSMSGHAAFTQAVSDAVADGQAQVVPEFQSPTLIALEHDETTSRVRSNVVSIFLYFAYLIYLVWFARSIRRVDAVHSVVGLAFTGVVEMLVSTITSLSVCAIVGFKVTMVPWAMLPVVILFIGTENMFSLVDAVAKTSIALPVKERIAEGLSKAGTSNTLKSISYNAILGVIAFFAHGVIRQFCAFAVVVLVAHWFLVHTFFTTVLSIDIQRLELDELLRQDSSLAPSDPARTATPVMHATTRWRKTVVAANNLLKGRATKNLSLVLLLAVTATLYYATYPTSAREEPALGFPHAQNRAKAVAHTKPDTHSPASNIWHMLNPAGDPLVHLRIESPTIVVLTPDGTPEPRPRPSASRPVVWLLKIVVVPIAATTGALYGLLLYLLKDAELLEAQRNRVGPEVDEGKREDEGLADVDASFGALPRAFESDVELLAASRDGRIVVAVGLDNSVAVWHPEREGAVCFDKAEDACSSSSVHAVTALAVDEHGEYCAVGTGSGEVSVWSIRKGAPASLPTFAGETPAAGVTELHFLTNPSRPGGRPGNGQHPPCLVVIHESRVAMKWVWDQDMRPHAVQIPTSGHAAVVKIMYIALPSRDTSVVCFCLEDGILELHDLSPFESLPKLLASLSAGNPEDTVVQVHALSLDIGGQNRLIVAAGTYAGVVSVWDASGGECICVLDDVYGDISKLRMTTVPRKTCPLCGELPPENFSLSVSVGHLIVFHRIYASVEEGRRCSCPRTPGPQTSSRHTLLGRRSRSSSQTSIVSLSSPNTMRQRLPSMSEDALFPVSGHGHHSRRSSEKDMLRRAPETLAVPLDGAENGAAHNIGLECQKSRYWQQAVVTRTSDTTCERGGWDVADGNVVGVRRKPRSAANPKDKRHDPAGAKTRSGLSPATLDRWEFWLFEPSSALLRVSPLSALERHGSAEGDGQGSPGKQPSCLPFTRVSPVVGGRTFCLAGFGNTVGLFNLAPGSA